MSNLDLCRPGILLRISANLYQLQLQVLKLFCLYNFPCCVFRLSFKENVFLSSTEFALSILDILMIFCFLKTTATTCNGCEFDFVMNQMLYIKWCCAQSDVAYVIFQYIEHCSISNVNVHRILLCIECCCTSNIWICYFKPFISTKFFSVRRCFDCTIHVCFKVSAKKVAYQKCLKFLSSHYVKVAFH